METVLVVEDDEATAAFLADNLEADGFQVAVAGGAAEALRAIAVRGPDLVVLDVMLEDGSGLAVLDVVRRAARGTSRIDPALPVLVLSGRSSETDRVRGFARGADDYVVKPFSYQELVARVRALLRRAGGLRRGGAVTVGDLFVDPGTRAVRVGDRSVRVTGKEFGLLHALAAEPTRVVPKGELLRDVWGYRAQ